MQATYLNTVSPPLDTVMKENTVKAQVTPTAAKGKPAFVQYVKNVGAWPRRARPYKIREAQNKKLLPAEKADVKMAALTIDGRTVCIRCISMAVYARVFNAHL